MLFFCFLFSLPSVNSIRCHFLESVERAPSQLKIIIYFCAAPASTDARGQMWKSFATRGFAISKNRFNSRHLTNFCCCCCFCNYFYSCPRHRLPHTASLITTPYVVTFPFIFVCYMTVPSPVETGHVSMPSPSPPPPPILPWVLPFSGGRWGEWKWGGRGGFSRFPVLSSTLLPKSALR